MCHEFIEENIGSNDSLAEIESQPFSWRGTQACDVLN